MRARALVLIVPMLMLATAAIAAEPDLSAGVALFEQGKYPEAKAFFEKHNTGKNAEAAYYLGRIAMEQEQFETAETHFENATALSPNMHAYVAWLGRAYGEHGRVSNLLTQRLLAPKIHKAFLRAVELKPDDVESRDDLVSFYIEAPSFLGGDFAKAKDQAKAMEKLDGAMAARAYARIARAEKNPEGAYAALKKGAAADPDDAELNIEAAIAAQELKKWDESFTLLEAVIQRDATAWGGWFHIGRASAISGQKLERGAEALRKFIAEVPKENPIPRDAAHNRLGQIYEKLKDNAKAKEQYAAAVKINPNNKDAAAGLARLGERNQ